MHVSSNRPTSISRLVWDADLEAKGGYKIKGDFVGQFSRLYSLTTDSSSGVHVGTIEGFTSSCIFTTGYQLFEYDFSEFQRVLNGPIYGENTVYYWDGNYDSLEDLSLQIYGHYNNMYTGHPYVNAAGEVSLINADGVVYETIPFSVKDFYLPSSSGRPNEAVMLTIPLDLDSLYRISVKYACTNGCGTAHGNSYNGGWRGVYLSMPSYSYYCSGVLE